LILSGRLGLIREMLPACTKLCDIGTDHARIPASALLDGLCTHAIATDIKPGPLERAARTIRHHDLAGRMEMRLGAGLDPVSPGECDVLVIAGMGALMITGMLESGFEVARRASCILLQPMHAQERLRPWLRMNGYVLLSERLACEGDKRYQVLAVRYRPGSEQPRSAGWRPVPEHTLPGMPADPASPVYDRVGYSIVNRPDPLAVPWAIDWIKRQKRIVEGLRRSGRDPEALASAVMVLEQLESCLMALQLACNRMQPGNGGCGT
jgi:tRNA A22 N-methylase